MDLLGTSMQSLQDVPVIHKPVNGTVLRVHLRSISNKRVQIKVYFWTGLIDVLLLLDKITNKVIIK